MSIAPDPRQQIGGSHTGQWVLEGYAGLDDYLFLIGLGLLIGVIVLIVRAWMKNDRAR